MNHATHTYSLSTEDFSTGYADTCISKNLNLRVKPGSFVCILGKNGSGKSTLLRSLSGLQNPLSGNLFIAQKNIQSYSSQALAKALTVVTTEPIPGNLYRVDEFIHLGRQIYTGWWGNLKEKDTGIVRYYSEIMRINSLLEKKFNTLSDGQKQRVILTKALVQDTALLILDEPTAHLDVHHSMEVFHILQKIARENQKTILIATHEIGLATQTADEIWLLDGQTLIAKTKDDMVQSGFINKIFDTDLVRFNKQKATFEFRNTHNP